MWLKEVNFLSEESKTVGFIGGLKQAHKEKYTISLIF